VGAGIFMSTFAWIFGWTVMANSFVPKGMVAGSPSCACREECRRFRTGLPEPSAHSSGSPFHDRAQRKIAAIEIRYVSMIAGMIVFRLSTLSDRP
jgi:hypothetical protein